MMNYAAPPASIQNWLQETLSTLPINLQVEFWNSQKLLIQGNRDRAEPALTLRIYHPGVLRALLLQRDPIILAEAYLRGFCDFVGSIDALLLFRQNLPQAAHKPVQTLKTWLQAITLPPLPLPSKPKAFWNFSPSRHRQRDLEAVQHHYDLGNDFYRLWLDPHMVYSCAYFPHENATLQEAQEAKLDTICRKLQLQPGETLLDIGCGWGSLLHWAAKHYGVKAYGITLSQNQVEYNRQWIGEQGWSSCVEVELRDYRDLPTEPTFDKIVSVGMVEHVGMKNYPTYFQSALSCLQPGGLFLNHGITCTQKQNQSEAGERFIHRYIFPNGELARLSTILTAAEDAGWEIVDVDAWRPHYAKTLRHWVHNLERVRDRALEHIDQRWLQLWKLYLLGSAEGFERNYIGISQTLLRRQGDTQWNLPLTRRNWLG